jgi:hypothetical protein
MYLAILALIDVVVASCTWWSLVHLVGPIALVGLVPWWGLVHLLGPGAPSQSAQD